MNKINIFRTPDEMYKDLRSGNYLWQGMAYPNAIDWDIVNAWSTRLWKKLTGIDESFLMTAGTTGMLDLIIRGGCTVFCVSPCYDGALRIFRDNIGEKNVWLADSLHDMLCMIGEDAIIPDYIYLNTNFRNPDGYSIPEEEMHEIVACAKIYDIIIIEDDPYFFLNEHKTKLSFLEIYDKTIYLNSFSKALGSPGGRLGCFATRNDRIRKDIWNKMMTRFMYSNPFVIQEAVEMMEIEEMDIILDKIRSHVTIRQNLFGFQGFYLWREKDEAYERLMAAGYKVKDGEAFGAPGYYRVSMSHIPIDSPAFAMLCDLYRI